MNRQLYCDLDKECDVVLYSLYEKGKDKQTKLNLSEGEWKTNQWDGEFVKQIGNDIYIDDILVGYITKTASVGCPFIHSFLF